MAANASEQGEQAGESAAILEERRWRSFGRVSLLVETCLDVERVSNHYNQLLQGTVKIVEEQVTQPGLLKIIEGSLGGPKKRTGRGSSNRFKSATEEFDWACGMCFLQNKKKSSILKHVCNGVCKKKAERVDMRKKKKREYDTRYYLENKVRRLANQSAAEPSRERSLAPASESEPCPSGISDGQSHEPLPPDASDVPSGSTSDLSGCEQDDLGEDTDINLRKHHNSSDPSRVIGFVSVDENHIFGEEKEFFLYTLSKNPLHHEEWANKEAFLQHRWCPDRCPESTDDSPCNVILHSKGSRSRCYDFPLPFTMRYDTYRCSIHQRSFSPFDKVVQAQLSSGRVFLSHDVICRNKTIMTCAFFKSLIRDFEATMNPTRIHKTYLLKWQDNITSKIENLQRLLGAMFSEVFKVAEDGGVSGDTVFPERFFEHLDNLFPQWKSVKYITFFSPGLISDIIVDWWNVEMEGSYQTYLHELAASTGQRLSGDHTYKCIKGVGVYVSDERSKQKRKWVALRLSLFSLLNEEGKVVACKICPSDQLHHVVTLLKAIWKTQKENDMVKTSVYLTDNAFKERVQIKSAFEEVFPDDTVEVLQDIFHARERVARTLRKSLPEYSQCLYSLRKLFVRFQKSLSSGGYKDKTLHTGSKTTEEYTTAHEHLPGVAQYTAYLRSQLE